MKIFKTKASHCVIALILLSPAQVIGASTISYQCTYLKYATSIKIRILKKPFKLSFVFDSQAKKAYIVGNQGSAKVAFFSNRYNGISFIEITQSGNVMVTAITQNGKSVHSRNGIIFGKLAASQYYGKCTIK